MMTTGMNLLHFGKILSVVPDHDFSLYDSDGEI
jgi:hypothetical protein